MPHSLGRIVEQNISALRFLTAAGLALLMAGCGPKANDHHGGGTLTCTPSNSVILATGAGSTNALCTQLSDSFPVNSQVCACTAWACIASGDTIQFIWKASNALNPHTDTFTRNDGKTSGYDISFCTVPIATGNWTVSVWRNGQNAATHSFTMF